MADQRESSSESLFCITTSPANMPKTNSRSLAGGQIYSQEADVMMSPVITAGGRVILMIKKLSPKSDTENKSFSGQFLRMLIINRGNMA